MSKFFSSFQTETPCSFNTNSLFLPLPTSWQPPFYFLFLWIWLLITLGISHQLNYVIFVFLWLPISLSIVSSRFSQTAACIRTSFLRAHHLFVDGPLGCFYLLANISNVAMNMSVQIFAWIFAFSSFGGIYPEVEFLDDNGNSIFNPLWNYHTLFHNPSSNAQGF